MPDAAAPSPPLPPPRPPAWEERFSHRLFFVLSPPTDGEATPPPETLAPFEDVTVPRRRGRGALSATWYPADSSAGSGNGARGAVLLLHPWMGWGRAYFHRRGRIPALRRAGYHALTVDLPGFGASGPPAGLLDVEVEEAAGWLRRRFDGLPLHVWGVSSGGYWAHPVLSRDDTFAGAMFEDVSPHLIEWGRRMLPWARPGYAFYQRVFRTTYRFLDMRRHAATIRARAVAYVSGETDPGVRPEDTAALAAAAGAEALIVPGAGHLQAIKTAGDEIIALALVTFARAEGEGAGAGAVQGSGGGGAPGGAAAGP